MWENRGSKKWRKAMKKSRGQLKAEFITEVEERFDELMEWEEQTEKPNLTQIEEIILVLRKRFGERMAQHMIKRQEDRQPAERVPCPQCGGEMATKGLKGNQVETRIGNLKIERGYYYCPNCKQGIFPPGSATDALGETVE
jgi:uncharacterized protein with PIN domain